MFVRQNILIFKSYIVQNENLKNQKKFSRLILPVTYDCNLDCEYCYVDKKTKTASSFLVWLKSVNFLIQHNKGGEVDIIFIGGEPLLKWKEIKKIIIYTQKLSKIFKVIIRTVGFPTNGLLLNEDILKFCRLNNISIAVSIDGPDNKRNTIKGENSFAMLSRKIKLFIKYRDVVRIRLTIHPDFVDESYNNFSFFVKKGFTKIDIQPTIGIKWDQGKIEHYLKNLEKILISYSRKQRIDMKHLNDFVSDCETYKFCPKIKEEFLVDLDGSIYPCEFFLSFPLSERKKYAIGTIFNGVNLSLAYDYKNKKLCDMGNGFANLKDKCINCSISQACYKMCLGFNNKTKEFDTEIAASNWSLLRGIEKIYSKFKQIKNQN